MVNIKRGQKDCSGNRTDFGFAFFPMPSIQWADCSSKRFRRTLYLAPLCIKNKRHCSRNNSTFSIQHSNVVCFERIKQTCKKKGNENLQKANCTSRMHLNHNPFEETKSTCHRQKNSPQLQITPSAKRKGTA